MVVVAAEERQHPTTNGRRSESEAPAQTRLHHLRHHQSVRVLPLHQQQSGVAKQRPAEPVVVVVVVVPFGSRER